MATGSEDGTVRLWNLENFDANKFYTLKSHDNAIKIVTISQNELWLVTLSENRIVCLWNLWPFNPSNPTVLKENGILTLAIDPYNHSLFTGSSNGIISKWDLDHLDPSKPVGTFSKHNKDIHAIAISSDTHWLVTGSDDGTARLWNLVEQNPNDASFRLPGHKGKVCAVAISPNNRWLAIGSNDNTVRIWELAKWDILESSKEPTTVRGYKDTIQALAISPDNHWLAIGCRDGTVHLQDLTDLAVPSLPLHPHSGEIRAMAVCPNSRWLVTGSADKTARLWDLKGTSNSYPVVLNPLAGDVHAVTVISDQACLVGSQDGIIRIWKLQDVTYDQPPPPNLPAFKELLGHPGKKNFNVLAVSPDNHWLISCNEDSTARLWDLKNWSDPGQILKNYPLSGHRGIIRAAAFSFSFDKRRLVTVSDDATARLWNLTESGPNLIAELPHDIVDPSDENDKKPQPVWVAAFTSDGRWLVTAGLDGRVRLWDLESLDFATPRPYRFLNPKAWGIKAAAISPKDHWLAVGNYKDGSVRLWKMETLTKPDNLPADPVLPVSILSHYKRKQDFNIVIFSPSGRWLITCNQDSTAYLWDLEDWNPPDEPKFFVLSGHTGPIRTATFSSDTLDTPGNRWLVTVSDDETTRLWDLTALDPSTTAVVLRGHEGPIWAATITPDNHWLITGSDDDFVRLWNLRLSELVELAGRTANRNLTWEEWKTYFPNQGYRQTFPHLPADISAIKERFKQAYKLNRKEEAQAAYEQVVKWVIETDDADLNSAIGRCGSIDGFADIVMPACERAVELDDIPAYRDSRALARAFKGDYKGAGEDLSYLETWRQDNELTEKVSEEILQKRQDWIQQLEKGQNPFDEAAFKNSIRRSSALEQGSRILT